MSVEGYSKCATCGSFVPDSTLKEQVWKKYYEEDSTEVEKRQICCLCVLIMPEPRPKHKGYYPYCGDVTYQLILDKNNSEWLEKKRLAIKRAWASVLEVMT